MGDRDTLKGESYIHEPYWRCGPVELEQYALRFLKALGPHVVDGSFNPVGVTSDSFDIDECSVIQKRRRKCGK